MNTVNISSYWMAKSKQMKVTLEADEKESEAEAQQVKCRYVVVKPNRTPS